MNREDFVTYEQALALRKLGFRKLCFYNYDLMGNFCPNVTFSDEAITSDDLLDCLNESDLRTDAPTLAQAHKWLISKSLLIVVYSKSFESWQYRICRKGKDFLDSELYEDFDSYEEALSDGITECIKLLENK